MRIRRHAKISPLVYATSFHDVPVQTHVCQLNQSPWDAGRFSPPSFSSEPPSFEADIFPDSDHLLHRPPEDYPGKTAAEETVESRPPIVHCKTEQCRREVLEEDSLCDHQVKEYSNKPIKTEKHPAAAAVVRPRRKKAPPSNPNVFYYYSRFGPRWGKKRTKEKDRSGFGYEYEVYGSVMMSEESDAMDDEQDEEEEIGEKRSRKPIKARSLKSFM